MLANLALPVVNRSPGEPPPARRPRFVVGTFLSVFAVVFLFALVSVLTETRVYLAEAIIKVPREPMDGEDMHMDMSALPSDIGVMLSFTLVEFVENRLTDSDRQALMAPYLHGSANSQPSVATVLAEKRQVRMVRFRPEQRDQNASRYAIQFQHPNRVIAAKVVNLFAEQYMASYLLRSSRTIVISESELRRLMAEHQLLQRELEIAQRQLLNIGDLRVIMDTSYVENAERLKSSLPTLEAIANTPAVGDYISPDISRALGRGFLLALGCGLAAAGTVWLAERVLGKRHSA
jgi:hypothetical protein